MTRDEAIARLGQAEVAAIKSLEDGPANAERVPVRIDPAMREFIYVLARQAGIRPRIALKYTLRSEVISQLAAVLILCAYPDDEEVA